MSFEDPEDTNEDHERRITRCRSCNARIIFLTTEKGSKMPVDADTVKAGDQLFEPDSDHVSHFATCPQAQEHRRQRNPSARRKYE